MIAVGPIGRGPAQRLARDELSKAIYHQRSIPQAIEHAIGSFLQRIFAGASQATPGGWWTVVAIAALAVLAGGAVAGRLGPLARSARGKAQVLEPGVRPLTARQLRELAEACAAEDDYSTAILQRLRAIAVGCEERGILPPDPGRTADEFATQAGAAFPGHGAELAAAARLFDQVRYGDGIGTRDGYERLSRLDTETARAAGGQGSVLARLEAGDLAAAGNRAGDRA